MNLQDLVVAHALYLSYAPESGEAGDLIQLVTKDCRSNVLTRYPGALAFAELEFPEGRLLYGKLNVHGELTGQIIWEDASGMGHTVTDERVAAACHWVLAAYDWALIGVMAVKGGK